jgi:hypothetical protein
VDARLLLTFGEDGGDPRNERFSLSRLTNATKNAPDRLKAIREAIRSSLRGLKRSFGYAGWSSAFDKFASLM